MSSVLSDDDAVRQPEAPDPDGLEQQPLVRVRRMGRLLGRVGRRERGGHEEFLFAHQTSMWPAQCGCSSARWRIDFSACSERSSLL